MRQGPGHKTLARESWLLIAAIVVPAVLSFMVLPYWVGTVLLLLLVPVGYLVRSPWTVIPSTPLAVLCPVSGSIKSVEPTSDPWLSRQCSRIVVRNGFWDVHVLRSPVEGKLMNDWSEPAGVDGCRTHAYWFRTDEGDDVVLALRLGRRAPLARMFAPCGERVGQGEQIGFLYFEGIVELYLPQGSRIDVTPGTTVSAGSGILGTFVHKD